MFSKVFPLLSIVLATLFPLQLSLAQQSLENMQRPNLHSFEDSRAKILFELPEKGPAYVAIGTSPDDLASTSSVETSHRFDRHNQTFSNLIQGETYYFQIVAGDNFELRSQVYFFEHPSVGGNVSATPYQVGPSLLLAKEPQFQDHTPDSVRISFSLAENGPAFIAFGTSENNLNRQGSVESSFRWSDHLQTIAGLEEGQTYYFRVIAGDGFELESKIYSFTHQAVEEELNSQPEGTISSSGPQQENSETIPQPRATINTPEPEPEGVGAGSILEISRTIFVEVGGTGNGSSVDNPMGDIQRAFDRAIPGTIIYVKAGNYGNQPLKLEARGLAGSPIILEGYRNTPGDSPSYNSFNHRSRINPNLMPLLDGGSRTNGSTGIRISGSYISLRNFQVTNFRNGVFGSGANHTLDNIVTVNLGDPEKFYHGHGIFMTGPGNRFLVKNSTVVNAGAQALTLKARNSIFDGNRAYCDDNSTGHDSATDYYFNVTDAFDNIIRNNYIERVGDLDHGGHGFQVKGIGERNLFENNIAVNIDGGGISVRHREAKNNIFRGNHLIGGSGILVRDEASENLFENNLVENSKYGVWFTDSVEQGRNGASSGNTFLGNTFRNVRDSAIEYRSTWGDPNSWSFDDLFENQTIDGAPVVFQADHRTRNITIRNSIIVNVPVWVQSRAPRTTSEFQPSVSNVIVRDGRFDIPR